MIVTVNGKQWDIFRKDDTIVTVSEDRSLSHYSDDRVAIAATLYPFLADDQETDIALDLVNILISCL